MPKFIYKAKDHKNNYITGTVETVDNHQVARILGRKGLVVIEVRQAESARNNLMQKLLNRVSFNDLVVITRQLSTMIESGLVLSECLDILRDQQKSHYFREVLNEVSTDVKNGLDLASALRRHPDVFSELYCNLIAAGEQSGKLDTVLTEMAENLEKQREFRSKLRGAMIYPAIIVAAMLAVMGIMFFVVVPRLTTLYQQSGIELPISTKIMISISSFMVNFWWLILIFVFLLTVAFRQWVSTPSGKFKFDAFILKVPIIGKLIQGSTLTEMTRTFGLLTTAGIPILESLTIVSRVIGNMVYRHALEESYKGVEKGLPLSTELQAMGIFPRIVPAMMEVGEQTGKVDEISFKLSDYFQQETDQMVRNLTVAIEPIVIVILGVMVGFLVFSIIVPIYKLTSQFSGG